MDIDLLSKMVKELILDNDKVTLPGLGCFVAEIVPASFSDKGYTINPPYRRLFFRAKPDEGTELSSFYAESNKVELAMADRIIRDFLGEMRNVLYEKKVVVFPGLGRLRATRENNIFFVADENLDIYPSGFGLEPVSLKTHQETQEEVTAAVVDLKNILQEPVQIVEPVPEPIAAPEPMAEPEPVPVCEPEPEPEPERKEEPAVKRTGKAEEQQAARKSGWKIFLKTILWLIFAAVLVLAAFVVLARVYPERVDSILYTPEELEIVRMLE